jgi:hypothetical protein
MGIVQSILTRRTTSVMVRALLLAIFTVDHIDYLVRRYVIGYWLRIPLP